MRDMAVAGMRIDFGYAWKQGALNSGNSSRRHRTLSMQRAEADHDARTSEAAAIGDGKCVAAGFGAINAAIQRQTSNMPNRKVEPSSSVERDSRSAALMAPSSSPCTRSSVVISIDLAVRVHFTFWSIACGCYCLCLCCALSTRHVVGRVGRVGQDGQGSPNWRRRRAQRQ